MFGVFNRVNTQFFFGFVQKSAVFKAEENQCHEQNQETCPGRPQEKVDVVEAVSVDAEHSALYFTRPRAKFHPRGF